MLFLHFRDLLIDRFNRRLDGMANRLAVDVFNARAERQNDHSAMGSSTSVLSTGSTASGSVVTERLRTYCNALLTATR